MGAFPDFQIGRESWKLGYKNPWIIIQYLAGWWTHRRWQSCTSPSLSCPKHLFPMAILGCILYRKSENVSKIRSASLSSELSNQRKGTGELSIYSWWVRNSGDNLRWQLVSEPNELQDWCQNCKTGQEASRYLVSEKKTSHFWKRRTVRDTALLHTFIAFWRKKNQPSRKNQSRMRGAEKASGKKLTSPDVSIKCYPTSLHASFSSQMKEMSQCCTQISAQERHWWWTSVSFLLIRIFILKKTFY